MTVNTLKKLMLPLLAALPLSLSGCSGLNPDALEVTLGTAYTSGLYDRTETVLRIRSVDSNPITVTGVEVNNGRCGYTDRYSGKINLPAHFQIGQSLELYVKCSYDAVVKVDVETDRGTASYSFK